MWINLYSGWAPSEEDNSHLGWALWQPKYLARPWPTDELIPGFTYYVCENTKTGRAITGKATVVDALPPTEVASPYDVYELLAEELFDDQFTIEDDAWHANVYNRMKSQAPWPQKVTAWRTTVNQVGPHVIRDLGRFQHTGWKRTDKIAL
ncbi:hypothetical protein Lesp02_62340 [Lentzea sp. NBRC 105346]|uniref:hypothetical protein n=1 Tax=Lentzea sp. NBRC 105346 TaxID=3032205 RepID=UPI002554258D|nr:hypothetical protein [Lentzea sp. NBRC 105346]GLZ34047.1 hypothetical protein Lesp02_62340 [Lentzea sp. NBRC 105346]